MNKYAVQNPVRLCTTCGANPAYEYIAHQLSGEQAMIGKHRTKPTHPVHCISVWSVGLVSSAHVYTLREVGGEISGRHLILLKENTQQLHYVSHGANPVYEYTSSRSAVNRRKMWNSPVPGTIFIGVLIALRMNTYCGRWTGVHCRLFTIPTPGALLYLLALAMRMNTYSISWAVNRLHEIWSMMCDVRHVEPDGWFSQFYFLATSKSISGWVPTSASVHSC